MDEGWLHAFVILAVDGGKETFSLSGYFMLRKTFVYVRIFFSDCKNAPYVSFLEYQALSIKRLKIPSQDPFVLQSINRRFLSVETKHPSQDICVGFLVEKWDNSFENFHLSLSNIMHPVIHIHLSVESGKVTEDAVL